VEFARFIYDEPDVDLFPGQFWIIRMLE